MDLEARIDDALTRIHETAAENERGFTSHAPMVVDTLVALRREDHIERFLDAYLPDFPKAEPAASTQPETPRPPWSGVLDPGADWRGPLDHALCEMAPTLFAAATHGLLRVAHAVRGLARRDTAVRRRELALAFEYWQRSAATLPGTPGAARGAHADAATLVGALEVVPDDERTYGLFTESVGALGDHAPFIDAVERLIVPDVVTSEHVSGLTGAMLEPYFESPLLRIAYVHTITAPSSLRLLAAHVRPQTLRALYGYGFQAVAALHSVSRLPTEHPIAPATRALADDAEALATRAADTLEEHVIKFTEACAREHEASGDERFRLAAADAIVAEEARAAAATRA